MSPRSDKQNVLIKQKKELLIIETALLLFSEGGFTRTSMESIAKKAKVSKGNLYNYFKSKEDLLEGVLRDGLNQFSEIFTKGNSVLLSEVDFEVAVRANFEMLQSNKMFWKLYYNLVTQPKVQDLFTKLFSPFLEQYMKIFEAYFENKGDSNPNATAMLLGSSIDGVSLGYLMMEETYPLEEVIAKLIEKFK
jgi:AcrR family transcriptional regulator